MGHTNSPTSTRTIVPPYWVEIRLLGPWRAGTETVCREHLCTLVASAPSRQLQLLRITCLSGPPGHRSLHLLTWLIPPSVDLGTLRPRSWGNVSLFEVTQLRPEPRKKNIVLKIPAGAHCLETTQICLTKRCVLWCHHTGHNMETNQ